MSTNIKVLLALFASDKRKSVLMILKDGPHEMEYVLQSLHTTRQSLLPQINILADHHLVNYYNNTCELTLIGKLILDKMLPLVNTVEVLDIDIEYWGTHNLNFIPLPFTKDK
jgi:predicted transcriptional regulator